MSILIAPICEKNRQAITQEFQNAIRILGSTASGNSPFLSNLVCVACKSKNKKFKLDLYDVAGICFSDVCYDVISDKNGNYVVSAPGDWMTAKEYNHLTIMDLVKKQLDTLGPENFEGDKDVADSARTGASHIHCECDGHLFMLEDSDA